MSKVKWRQISTTIILGAVCGTSPLLASYPQKLVTVDNQAAIVLSKMTSHPSQNLTPVITFGN